MSHLYWQFESQIGHICTISLRARGENGTIIPRQKYDDYVKNFKTTYSDKIIKCYDTSIIHPYREKIEYVTIISLNIEPKEIKYPGYSGSVIS